MSPPRIYLDNAATSWPKPESVYRAVDDYQRLQGVAAGRGSYRVAEELDRTIRQTRVAAAQLLQAPAEANVIFTFNCTDALNLALHGLLRSGDHVVTSVAEHNSILRPLAELSAASVETTYVPVEATGCIDLQALQAAIRPTTKLIAVTHASNVTGMLQPIDEIAEIARASERILLVDAAQTLGHVPVEVSDKIDLLAAPGHKGLFGPLGTGLLYLSPRIENQVRSCRQGGTGTQSEFPQQPPALPEKFEAGNLNVPGLMGLAAGIDHVQQHQLCRSDVLSQRTQQLLEGLATIPSATVYSPVNPCGIVSFNLIGYDPREVASLLDSAGGFEVRAGLHCAPWMHRFLGTLHHGGTVRVSFGHFNTASEVDQLVDLVRSLADALPH